MRPLVNFRQLEILRAIFLTGSVTGAAERLGVTQPAVSHALRDIEERIGCKLFERELGRIAPTKKGLLLWEEIRRSFSAFERVNDFCRRVGETEARDIVISSVPIVSAVILPQAIRSFREARGARFFRIRPQDTANAIASVRFQTADLSFGVNLNPVPGVESADIVTYDLLCVLPPGHEAGCRDFVTFDDVASTPLISLSDIEGIGPSINAALPRAEETLRIAVECPSAITAMAMVEAGVGFTLLDPLSSHLFRQTGVQTRPFRPAVQITIRAYWRTEDNDHFDRAFFLALARERAAAFTGEASRSA